MSEYLKTQYELAKVIKQGHFKLTSGRHSDTYINKDSVYASRFFFDTMSLITDLCVPQKFDIITGPAVAGAVLAAGVYTIMFGQTHANITFIYPEKMKVSKTFGCPECEESEEIMVFRRGYDKLLDGKKVLIVEDIITTGGSVMKTVDAIEKNGGTVAEVVCIWNRTQWEPTDRDFEVTSIFNDKIESWEADECPLCKEGVPLTDPKTGMEITE